MSETNERPKAGLMLSLLWRITKPNTINDVVRKGLCTGCGLCEGLAGRQQVRMALNAQGFLRPAASQAFDPQIEQRILEVCPGINQRPHLGNPDADPQWGPIKALSTTQVTDETTRFEGSSGGAITAITGHLLDRGDVKTVLHVMFDPERPMQSKAIASRSREDIRKGTGSRYGPVGPLVLLEDFLKQDDEFAVVGKPCDVAAIRNFARVDPRLDRLIKAVVSFPCGGLPSYQASTKMAAKYGFVEQDVTMLRHRGHGCPGATRIESRNGRAHEQDFDDTWFKEFGDSIQFRCKICPDSTGEQADLVCGDAWDVDGKRDNINLVIERTERGSEIVRVCVEDAIIKMKPLDDGALVRMQPHHLARKSSVAARLTAMALAGQPLPAYQNMGILKSTYEAKAFLGNLFGTFKRLMKGANRESLPLWPS